MRRRKYWCPVGCGKSVRFDMNTRSFHCSKCNMTISNKKELVTLQKAEGLE